MFTNRKERKELLEGLVISNIDAKIPAFKQVYIYIYAKFYNFLTLMDFF
jgi:hypothetical protein